MRFSSTTVFLTCVYALICFPTNGIADAGARASYNPLIWNNQNSNDVSEFGKRSVAAPSSGSGDMSNTIIGAVGRTVADQSGEFTMSIVDDCISDSEDSSVGTSLPTANGSGGDDDNDRNRDSSAPFTKRTTNELVEPTDGEPYNSSKGTHEKAIDSKSALKMAWKNLMEIPPSPAQLKLILQGVPFSEAVALTDNPVEVQARYTNDSFATPLLANGTDKESLYRQLVSQISNPLASGGTRSSLWLDQEFALNLKGTAVLAQYPELLFSGDDITVGQQLKVVHTMLKRSRGIRLKPIPKSASSSSEGGSDISQQSNIGSPGNFGSFPDFSNFFGRPNADGSAATTMPNGKDRNSDSGVAAGPSGLIAVQERIVRALAHSLGSNLFYLNRGSVDEVRATAVALGADRRALTKGATVAALIDVMKEGANDDRRSNVVLLNDDLEWLLCNEDASKVLLEELTSNPSSYNTSSRSFFIAIEPDEDVSTGLTSPSVRAQTNGGDGGSEGVRAFQGNPGVGDSSRGAALPPRAFSGNYHDFMKHVSNIQPGSGNGDQRFQSNGGPFFGLPGRSFQVVVQNGTATMKSLPPGMVPAPPEHVVRRMINDHHERMMQQWRLQQNNASHSFADSSFPPLSGDVPDFAQLNKVSFHMFPPDANPELVREFMENPENQAKIKGMIGSVIGMVQQYLSEGKDPSEMMKDPGFISQHLPNWPTLPGDVDVKVHMMQIPFPFPTPPGQTSARLARTPDSDKAPSTQMTSGKKKAKRKLPGSFFQRFSSSQSDDGEQNGKAQSNSKGDSNMNEEANENSKSSGQPEVDNLTQSSGRRTSTGSSGGGSGGSKGSKQQDLRSSGYSDSGQKILNLLDELPLKPPTHDHALNVLWDRFIDEEIGDRILLKNRRLLHQELRRMKLKHQPGSIVGMHDLLRRQVLSKAEVRRALLAAVKLQASRYSARENELISPLEIGVDINNTSSRSLSLSYWALDTAFCTEMRVPTPRLGRPVARSKEEIANMNIDKHEKALIANVITPQDIGVTYNMIGGLDDVKEMLQQSITYPLKYPRLYQEGVAADAVKGVLLFGPPGTGKTMLAKAVATEGGATFLSIDASTIENKWLGESEKNARAVFSLARRLAPCVIYMDEVDSVLSSRENRDDSSHGTLTSVKTTLMQEWDGLRTTRDRVVVIASTNRPFDLDEAVLRRLPRRILVDLPDLRTRKEILQVTLSGNRVDAEVDLNDLAEQLEGFTGSDIKEVCREAVVRVSHERAKLLESGNDVDFYAPDDSSPIGADTPLRPVGLQDFQHAMRRLKASVDESGTEMSKVMEWNEKYGEFKRKATGTRSSSADKYSLYV